MPENKIIIEPIYDIPLEKQNPFGKNLLDDLSYLLSLCNKYCQSCDINLITKAFYFCVDSHKNIVRKSGEPYYTHPLKVAVSLINDFSVRDTQSIIAALLHDTIEDVEGVTNDTIKEKFGDEILGIVDAVTKIRGTMTRTMDKTATYGKLFLALIKDVRVILIKLADRLDNMKTLFYLNETKQKAIAEETLNFYTPFAQRLGLTKVKKQLEDLSLYFIDKQTFNNIHSALIEKRNVFLGFIKNFLVTINSKLTERNIPHTLTMEHKHVYEIYTMLRQGKSLDEIDNFYSMVIVLMTNDYSEAYRAYGIIANIFGPVSSLDDYISRPKINLYRALHSTHLGPNRKLIEVIIRTKDMDYIVDKGIVATGQLTRQAKPLSLDEQDVKEWVDWMQEIIKSGDEDAIQKIWGSIKVNLYGNDIVVHIKDGDSYILPDGSCIIDLAFAVSQKIAMKLISAKVNGNVKSLDYELKNHDKIELITSPNTNPDPQWQNFVITNKAVVKLHKYFSTLEKNVTEKSSESEKIIKLKIFATNRKGLIEDIRKEIGLDNIQRIFLFSSGYEFEAIFHIKTNSALPVNIIFTKILSVKGITGIEKIEK
ncbi:bifunctional (p)ppGpp synthetase/guanosine-3',5'-bis(diphosphate) 3'-pyrophosphohydrolase [Bacteroidetes/Chlorobi group bacterium ChocPot_Mid]|nr:MAG: bifunctional (p)ppGpp synthetase/guanosine-3',5'-bis(diphosphate) 3'-pyrophosphohydrolase [Bacteroidetes/Chlorobi group bacterium ChocPot_Mid]